MGFHVGLLFTQKFGFFWDLLLTAGTTNPLLDACMHANAEGDDDLYNT